MNTKRKNLVDEFPETDEPIDTKTRAAIRRAYKEIKAGKGRGPFKNAKELIEDLHRQIESGKKK